eukprot:TRINITY_DN10405_c0_g2_i1.p2 TRINITY_DN10405_c0_g2~~TRINITY_DN10405_c0_g2_i1.p2  ORF type:complete len:132 (+),score=32.53 TRINITY_DN10405_c0_g2_i1:989-1384(+)
MYVGYYTKVPGQLPSSPNITFIAANSSFNYLFTSTTARKAEVTVFAATNNASETSCSLTMTLASSTLAQRQAMPLHVVPTASLRDYSANKASFDFPQGQSVLRLEAGGCFEFHPHNNITTVTMSIGAIYVS